MEKIPRRDFLKQTITAAGAMVTPEILLNAAKEKGEIFERMIVINPEEIPELLKEYDQKYPNWVAKAEHQRLRVLEYIKSDNYKEKLKSQFKEYFSNLGESEISELAQSLYDKRLEVFRSKKIRFEKLEDDQKGFYNPDNAYVSIDTLNAGPFKREDGSKTERYDLFVTAHEYEHTTQSHDLMFAGVFHNIIDSLVRKNSLSKELADKIKERVTKDSKKITKEGRVDVEDEDKFGLPFYSQRPSEVMSYMMQIRITLDVFSSLRPDVIGFDMTKDSFTDKHLDFLIENRQKFFQGMTLPNKNIQNFTILDAMLMHFQKEDFIVLMNQV